MERTPSIYQLRSDLFAQSVLRAIKGQYSFELYSFFVWYLYLSLLTFQGRDLHFLIERNTDVLDPHQPQQLFKELKRSIYIDSDIMT